MTSDYPATVLDAVRLLERDGYGGDLIVRADGLHCPSCDRSHAVGDALVERVYRFEGPSDPDEEAIVLAMRCPRCDALGTVVSAFGPSADPEVLDALVMLDARFRELR